VSLLVPSRVLLSGLRASDIPASPCTSRSVLR
jgi:hypothetical protein